jgi:hypothetical protein
MDALMMSDAHGTPKKTTPPAKNVIESQGSTVSSIGDASYGADEFETAPTPKAEEEDEDDYGDDDEFE